MWGHVKGTEPAAGHADIGIVDIPVLYIGDIFFWMEQKSFFIGKAAKDQKICILIQIKGLFAVNPLIFSYFFNNIIYLVHMRTMAVKLDYKMNLSVLAQIQRYGSSLP